MDKIETYSGQKLRFRILECSSEDPQYPVSELLASSSQSKGWQSQRFCSYPQYITFQFLSPVILKQLQFLCHETKISSKLELFVALPDMKAPLPYTDIKFKKLGFLSVDPNEKSGFQLRELKTVHIEVPCTYLRVVFHKCHINKFNFFNQVGLIALAAFGETIGSQPMKAINNTTPQTYRPEKSEYAVQIDESTSIKISELEEAKLRAVENENFEEAQSIKKEISSLQQVGAHLQRLEERKALAIRNEDYETAKFCKKEIDKLRRSLTQTMNDNKSKSKQSYKQLNQAGAHNSLEHNLSKEDTSDSPDTMDRRPSKNFQGQDRTDTENEELEEAKDINQQDEREEEDEDFEASPTEDTKNNKDNYASSQITHDEQIIPALLNKNKTPEDEMQSQRDIVKEAESLSPTNQKLAEPLIPIIGEELCKKIFSKHWNLREDGLSELTGKVSNMSDQGNAFVALIGVVHFTISDKVSQVANKAMNILQMLMAKNPSNVGTKTELMVYIDVIINVLLEKLGDNNSRIRDQAEDAFLCVARNSIVTCNYCVNAFMKDSNLVKSKSAQSARQILGKIKLLQKIIKEFKINNQDVPYTPIIEYCRDKLEHPNAEVRSTVVNIFGNIYALMGDQLIGDLKGVRATHLEMLQKEFDKKNVDNGHINNSAKSEVTSKGVKGNVDSGKRKK